MGNSFSQETHPAEAPVGRLRIYPVSSKFDFPQFPRSLPFKLNGVIKASEFEEAIGSINEALHVDEKHGCYLTTAGLFLCLGGCVYCCHYVHTVRENVRKVIRDINKNVFDKAGIQIHYFHVAAGEDEGFKANHWLEIELASTTVARIARLSSARTSLSLTEAAFVTKPEPVEEIKIRRIESKEKKLTKEKKSSELSAQELFASDSQLKKVDRSWGRLASDESIERTVKSLVANKVKVDVVGTREAALDILKAINVRDSSVYVCGSTTLEEIGWTKFLKEHKDHAKRNIKAESVAAGNRGDREVANELMREGMRADYVFTSVPAISEKGDLAICCMTGTRTGAFAQTAKTLVVVAGTNKIVPDYETALKRMNEYAFPLESARVRVAFKNLGVSASAINFSGAIRGTNPYDPSLRLHVVLVKQHLGF